RCVLLVGCCLSRSAVPVLRGPLLRAAGLLLGGALLRGACLCLGGTLLCGAGLLLGGALLRGACLCLGGALLRGACLLLGGALLRSPSGGRLLLGRPLLRGSGRCGLLRRLGLGTCLFGRLRLCGRYAAKAPGRRPEASKSSLGLRGRRKPKSGLTRSCMGPSNAPPAP